MSIELSKRSKVITQSEIRAMSRACAERGGINLSQGVCDTETPEVVLAGAQNAIKNGQNSYTRSEGTDEIRQAISKRELNNKGLNINADEEIVVSAGATGAFYSAVLALLNPNDEIVVFEPYYGYHVSTLESANVKINFVRLEGPNWKFTKDMVESAVTPKTKAILINTPSNPSGKIFTREELLVIGDIAKRNNLVIISDEIYEQFVYDGQKHISPIEVNSLRDRTVLVGGFSKTFSITGWRVGYTIAPKRLSSAISHMSDLVFVCAPAPLQAGVSAGINKLSEDHYKELLYDHKIKRDMICNSLSSAGFEPSVPNGAYYVLADISSIGGDSCKDRAIKFLDESGVAGVPGSAFYHDSSGDHLIRFCFAKDMDIIEQCCKRIEMYGESISS
jgi:aminotransferase